MVYCSKCGSQNSDEAVFCKKCGTRMDSGSDLTRTEPYNSTGVSSLGAPPPDSTKSIGTALGVVVVVVVLIIAVVFVAFLLGSDGSSNQNQSQYYSGSVAVTITNDNWFFGQSYSVYIDGIRKASDSVGALSSETWTFPLTWYGTSSKQISISVVWGGGTESSSVVVMSGGVASCTIHIG